MKKFFIISLITLMSCANSEKKVFSEKALNDTFISLENKEISFKNIINQYKGKNVVINVWASWCGDCIKGLPKIVELQKKHPEAVYLFLSLDKNTEDWKNGIEKYNIKGEQYFIQSGRKGPFAEFLNVDWIPRYLVIGKDGNIKVFKQVHADDEHIEKALN